MRFFMLDRITEWTVGKEARGRKCVALSEDFFEDHFPEHPVMPGVLIIEAMAQLGGLLIEDSCQKEYGRNIKAVLTILENIKFRNMALPGDVLDLHCTVICLSEESGSVKCRATVGDRRIAEGRLIFAYVEEVDESLEKRRRDLFNFWTEGMRS